LQFVFAQRVESRFSALLGWQEESGQLKLTGLFAHSVPTTGFGT